MSDAYRIHAFLEYIRRQGAEVEIDLTRSGVHALHAYPDSIPAIARVDQYPPVPEAFTISPDVLLTAGASGASALLLMEQSLWPRAKRSTIGVEWPAYPMFESLAAAFRLQVKRFRRIDTISSSLPTLQELLAANPDIGLICITDPHNPTAAELSTEELQRLCDDLRKSETPLLVDRAFADFAVRPLAYESISFNGYIVRSYSKSLGLAGERTGWLTPAGDATVPHSAVDLITGQPFARSVASTRMDRLRLIYSLYFSELRERVAGNGEMLASWAATTDGQVEVCEPESGLPFRLVRVNDAGSDLTQSLRNASVATVPGELFNLPAGYLRLGLGGSSQSLAKGLERITICLKGQERT